MKLMGRQSNREKVLDFLKEHEGEKFTGEEIKDETGVSITDIRTSGILEWVESDRYGNVFYYNGLKKYIFSLKTYFIAIMALYAFTSIIGFIFSNNLDFLWSSLQEHFEAYSGYSNFRVLVSIFLNNIWISFLAVVLGILVGAGPVLITSINGLVFGLAFSKSVQLMGVGFFLLATIPHGIIEIPIFLLSNAIGVRIGHETVRGYSISFESTALENGLKLYTLLIPLFLLAAFIESYITSSIL